MNIYRAFILHFGLCLEIFGVKKELRSIGMFMHNTGTFILRSKIPTGKPFVTKENNAKFSMTTDTYHTHFTLLSKASISFNSHSSHLQCFLAAERTAEMLLTLPQRPPANTTPMHSTRPLLPQELPWQQLNFLLLVFYIKVCLLHINICTKVSSLAYYLFNIFVDMLFLKIIFTFNNENSFLKAITMSYCFLCTTCFQLLPLFLFFEISLL